MTAVAIGAPEAPRFKTSVATIVASDAEAKLTILFPIKIANNTSSNRSATFSAFLAPGLPSSTY